jgi:hypothetical protein
MINPEIKVKTHSIGLNSLVLEEAVDGYLDFKSLGTTDKEIYYGIACGINWEIGRGYYSYSLNTINRNVCIRSSNYNKFIKLTGTSYVFNITSTNQDSLNYNSFGTIPENEKFLVGQSGELVYRYMSTGDIYTALGYIPYSNQNLKGYLNKDSLPEDLISSSGKYINPRWIVTLDPSKVENNIPQWNANKLQDKKISTIKPVDNQILSFNSNTNQWEPRNIN